MKTLAILGSTGSIGRQTLEVVESLPGRFRVVALAAGGNIAHLAATDRAASAGTGFPGADAGARELSRIAARSRHRPLPEIHWHGGNAGGGHASGGNRCFRGGRRRRLEATYAAVEGGKTVALSNKEVLVAAGEVVMAAAKRHGVELLPVDSEHNAIHQCLRGGESREVQRLILTASGGPFRKTPLTGSKT